MISSIDDLLKFSFDIFQKKEIRNVLHEISSVAGCLWEKGWAERNAGNFSLNLTGLFTAKELDRLTAYPFLPLEGDFSSLSGTLLLVSITGTRMRDMIQNPAGHVCFIFISPAGNAYHIIADNNEGMPVAPTSELSTHLTIQQWLKKKNAAEKVVLHAHVTEFIALTQLPGFQSEDSLNRIFFGMHPETATFLPEGAGFVPYTLPGTVKIARASLKALKNHRVVVWEKHGGVSVGENLSGAFDNLDLLAKAARIWFLCKSAGTEPEGLSATQLNELGTP